MGPRTAYKKVRKRIGKTSVGKRLKRTLKARRAKVATPAPREAPVGVFIVAEKDFPRADAPLFYAGWLEWVALHDPELFSQIRVTHLPAEPPVDMSVLHAWVQDPVRERNEPLFRQLEALEARARLSGANVIHPASVLSHSSRDAQYHCLTQAGLRTPRVVDVKADFADGFDGLSLPFVVRKVWGHQNGMLRLDSEAEVARWLEEQGADPSGWIAAEYIDVKSADGNYRKYRYVLFGERGVCRHLIVSPHWEVRPKDRLLTDETIAEELAFVAGPCQMHDAFNAACQRFEFDIAAFDYSIDPNGEVVVWEVNPYPDLSLPNGRPGEYLADSVTRTYAAFAALYRERLAAVRSARARWLGLPYLVRRLRYSRTS